MDKGNDKHENVDSVLHNTTSHMPCLYKIQYPSAVVPEKSDTNFPIY